jgi:hypothetical protein
LEDRGKNQSDSNQSFTNYMVNKYGITKCVEANILK